MPGNRPNRYASARSASLIALLCEIAMIVCGLTMAVIPLALWVAWSRTVFAGILVTCMLAMAIIVVLSRFGDDDAAQTGEKEPGKQKLDDTFHDELRRHVPLVNHRRRLSDPRMRR